LPFRDLVGHRRVLGLLARSAARGRLPPSLIFEGPEGIGKARTATALAQALNCRTPIVGAGGDELDLDGCGRCPACQRIVRGVHPDVLRIEPGDSGSIKIEQVREAIERAVYRPFEGMRRVVSIDQADALVIGAQHALLKTLEEPPSASVFVLVTARADALLPTVRSRCARLRFGRLTAAEVATVLIQDHGYDEPDARAGAALADGSIGRALEAQAADFVAARAAAHHVLRVVASGADVHRRLDAAKEMLAEKRKGGGPSGSERDHLAVRLRALASLVRDVGVLTSRADPSAIANADLEAGLHAVAARFDSDRAIRAFSAVDRALEALEGNASPKIVADWLVLQF
jgi:DNA polymerase III subunit delta'